MRRHFILIPLIALCLFTPYIKEKTFSEQNPTRVEKTEHYSVITLSKKAENKVIFENISTEKLTVDQTTDRITEQTADQSQDKPQNKTENQTQEKLDNILDDFNSSIPSELPEIHDSEDLKQFTGIKRILSELFSGINRNGGGVSSFLLFMFGCATILALCGNIQGKLKEVTKFGLSFLTSVAVFSKLYPIIEETSKSLSDLNTFFSSTIPISVSLTTLGGGLETGAVRNLMMSLTLRIYGAFSGRVLLAFALSTFFASLLGSVSGGAMQTLSENLKKIFTRGMALLTTLLTATMTFQTIITTSIDGLSIRALKHATSQMIPIVGGTVSSALATLGSGLSGTGRLIGAGSVAVIVFMALSPIGLLLVYKLCIFFADFLLQVCNVKNTAISALSSSLDVIISVFTMTTLIYLLETIMFFMGGAFFFE